MVLQADQKRYLKGRLQRINNEHGTYSTWGKTKTDSAPVKPAAVIEAGLRIKRDSAIVSRHQKRVERHQERVKKAKRKFADRCEREILSGNFKAALALLDKFESMKF